jgi:hypothetical protein
MRTSHLGRKLTSQINVGFQARVLDCPQLGSSGTLIIFTGLSAVRRCLTDLSLTSTAIVYYPMLILGQHVIHDRLSKNTTPSFNDYRRPVPKTADCDRSGVTREGISNFGTLPLAVNNRRSYQTIISGRKHLTNLFLLPFPIIPSVHSYASNSSSILFSLLHIWSTCFFSGSAGDEPIYPVRRGLPRPKRSYRWELRCEICWCRGVDC